MVRTYREYFNRNFTTDKYINFLRVLGEDYPPLTIRFAETPVFIPDDLKN